jgi:hypothetical protein
MAVTLLMNLRISAFEGAALGILFIAQFVTPHRFVPREVMSGVFLGLAAVFLVRQIIEMRPFARMRAGGGAAARPPPA